MTLPGRVFLDTNVYIVGENAQNTAEGGILRWLGFGNPPEVAVEIIVSEELVTQILQVATRLKHKDWGGELLGRIWQNPNIRYVILNASDLTNLEQLETIPREDIGVYLTAKIGQVNCFVSATIN